MLKSFGIFPRFVVATCLMAPSILAVGCGSGSVAPGPGPTPVKLVSGITFSPSTLNFGTTPVGSTSAPQTFTITSSGTGPLTLGGGVTTGDYTYTTNTCVFAPATLAAGTSCTVTVAFTPFQPGARSGSGFVTNDAAVQPAQLTFTGTGGSTGSTLASAALNFGPQQVGSVSTAQTLTITANGPSVLFISNITTSGDFTRTGTTCTAALAVGNSCNVSVSFAPTASLVRTGSLTISSNGTSSPQTVALSGSGVTPPTVAGQPITVQVKAGDCCDQQCERAALRGGSYGGSKRINRFAGKKCCDRCYRDRNVEWLHVPHGCDANLPARDRWQLGYGSRECELTFDERDWTVRISGERLKHPGKRNDHRSGRFRAPAILCSGGRDRCVCDQCEGSSERFRHGRPTG